MSHLIQIEGLVPYAMGQTLQQELLELRIADRIPDTVVLLEHAPVITIGRAKNAQANVAPNNPLPTVDVKRGGDVTLHAPGQWVVYPILQLTDARKDLLDHMRRLEKAVIAFLNSLGLNGQRDERNTGVWLPNAPAEPLKVCSIGIACRKWVTWHGLALNWDIDMSLYQYLHPCGFSGDVMTRVADWTDVTTTEILQKTALLTFLAHHLQLEGVHSASFSAQKTAQIPEFLAKFGLDE